MNKATLATVFILSYLVFVFTRVSFDFTLAQQILAGALSLAFFFLSAKRGLYQFFVVSLASFSTAISLGCAFNNVGSVSGPLVINLNLHPWAILVISATIASLLWLWAERSDSKKSFPVILFVLFVLNWFILAVNVRYFEDWKIENWLTVPFALLIYLTHRWFRFSNVSYGLMFVFMMLHIFGSHYTYAEVPFGYFLQDIFMLGRNHYDRVVHFSFGFLFAYPIREIAVRISDTRGVWSYWFPIEFVLAFSCVYEILEWGVAVIFGGDLGVAYLGTQGDVWDAQKDMFLAGIGATLAMLIIALIVWHYRRNKFWRELWESMSVKHSAVLGEEALRHLAK